MKSNKLRIKLQNAYNVHPLCKNCISKQSRKETTDQYCIHSMQKQRKKNRRSVEFIASETWLERNVCQKNIGLHHRLFVQNIQITCFKCRKEHTHTLLMATIRSQCHSLSSSHHHNNNYPVLWKINADLFFINNNCRSQEEKKTRSK